MVRSADPSRWREPRPLRLAEPGPGGRGRSGSRAPEPHEDVPGSGHSGAGTVRVRQVHGTRIVTPAESPAEALAEADGILVRAGDPWVAVSVADCAPVALVARDGSHAALLHSGWRATRGKIAGAGVRMLAERGIRAS